MEEMVQATEENLMDYLDCVRVSLDLRNLYTFMYIFHFEFSEVFGMPKEN